MSLHIKQRLISTVMDFSFRESIERERIAIVTRGPFGAMSRVIEQCVDRIRVFSELMELGRRTNRGPLNSGISRSTIPATATPALLGASG